MSEPEAPPPANWLDALRKRKLVQWAAGYAAAAWVALQVLTLVGQQFGWSPGVLRAITIALGVGFFLTLVLAWFHGERGQQKATAGEIAVLAVIVLAGAGLMWRFGPAPVTSPAASGAPTAVAGAIPTIEADPSIAVLPLVNMSSDKEQEYFSDGISEELLNLLTKVPKLRVIARTSSFSFKGKEVPIGEIARTLNVAAVLEGSVRKSNDKVRITVQLIRAIDGSHLWSETYNRKLDDIFAIQDEIAADVVKQLKVTLLGAAPKARTTDAEAYAGFLRAVQLGRSATADSFDQSDALYRQMLAADPSYAPAWDGLARNMLNRTSRGLLALKDGLAPARDAATKALAFEPGYAPAVARLGAIALLENDTAMAAQLLERALALDPSDSSVLTSAANMVSMLGRHQEALALRQAIVQRDPLNVAALGNLAISQHLSGRLDDSIATYRTVVGLSPGRLNMHSNFALALLQKGDAKAALAEAAQEKSDVARLLVTAAAYYALGRKSESDAALATLIDQFGKSSPASVASVLAFRDEPDRAFEWLDRAAAGDEGGLAAILTDSFFDKLGSDPRWLPFLRKLGKAPEQLAKIEFKVDLSK